MSTIWEIENMSIAAAPETLTGHVYNAKKADLWSCGILLYVMLYGHCPFDNWEDVLTKDIKLPARPPVSEAAKEIIRRICVRDPDARLSLEGMCEHRWAAEVSFHSCLHYQCCHAFGAHVPKRFMSILDM
jgi:serine/threonine protein kinase